MIRRPRMRRLLAPSADLVRAVLLFIVGLIAFGLGMGLSYRSLVLPLFQTTHNQARWVAETLVGGDVDQVLWISGGLFLLFGTFLTLRSARAALNHIFETLMPGLKGGKMDVYLRRQQLAQGPRIVAIGGGTGLSTLLRGLKTHSSNITAIVTVTDDGGSSGRLRRDKAMIPPGDIRNCLVALADAEKSMTDLFQHRFAGESGHLSGHSMGNLLIAALVDQAHGDFEKAIQIASDVLSIRGRVVPSTLEKVGLCAELNDGQTVRGETAIVEAAGKIHRIELDPPTCRPTQEALDAIAAADLIVVGPGSVFTSVVPNLLVPDVAAALKAARAPKVYVCNVMTQTGETDEFTASEHVSALLTHVGSGVIDYAMVNTAVPSEEARRKYAHANQSFVDPDIDRIRALGIRVIAGDYVSETDVVRHDPMKVASRLVAMVAR
jgi:uncharacterized cofD-like protein